jgi:hypothetical protein
MAFLLRSTFLSSRFALIAAGIMVLVPDHWANMGGILMGRGVVRLKDRPENLAVSRQYIHLFKQME